MSKTNKTEHNKKRVIEALVKSLGVVTTACKIADISRTQFYYWCKEDEAFYDKVRDVSDIALDFAESQLFNQIKDGNTGATIFYLKTKGKARGFVERQEMDHTSAGEPIKININLDHQD